MIFGNKYLTFCEQVHFNKTCNENICQHSYNQSVLSCVHIILKGRNVKCGHGHTSVLTLLFPNHCPSFPVKHDVILYSHIAMNIGILSIHLFVSLKLYYPPIIFGGLHSTQSCVISCYQLYTWGRVYGETIYQTTYILSIFYTGVSMGR